MYWQHTLKDCQGERTWLSTYFDKYPHLFRKLEWWEERKENDMPDYLKSVKSNLIVGVITWHTNHVTVGIQNDFFNREDIELTRKYLPATESEYNQYISTKEK
jgi:hypothetical protein